MNKYKEKSHFFVGFFSLWACYIFDCLTPFKDGRNPYSKFSVTFEIKMVDFWQHLCLGGLPSSFLKQNTIILREIKNETTHKYSSLIFSFGDNHKLFLIIVNDDVVVRFVQ